MIFEGDENSLIIRPRLMGNPENTSLDLNYNAKIKAFETLEYSIFYKISTLKQTKKFFFLIPNEDSIVYC